MILYGTSAWPANYYFFILILLCCNACICLSFFAIEAHLNEKRRGLFIVLSGSVFRFVFMEFLLSSFDGFLCFSIFLYFNLADLRTNRKNLIVYTISFYSIAAPFISSAYIYVKEASLRIFTQYII